MVFFHHAFGLPFLWSGVDLFFVLSGFLITNILLRDSQRLSFGQMLRQFYIRRAQRILPAYLFCLALIALLSHVQWSRIWPFYAFFLQNIPDAFHLIPFGALVPLWSLAVEQHFYLVWPLVVFFLPRRYLAPTMVVLLLAVPILRWFCTPLFADPDPIYALTPFRIDTIAAGALAALWLSRADPKQAIRFGQAAMLCGVTGLALLKGRPWFVRSANSPQFNCFAYSLNILLLGGFFIWVVLLEKGWLFRILSWRPLRELGRISYSFYLLHLLVLQEVLRKLHGWSVPLVAFCITALLATLSWKLIEEPVLSLRLIKPQPRRTAVA